MSIKQHTRTQHSDALARYLPGGPLFEAKFVEDSILRGWIDGSSSTYHTAEGFLKLLYDDYPSTETNSLLDEWERMLGIPDDCFPKSEDPDTRRLYICVKLMARGVQTVQDFQDLADKMGVTAIVTPGADFFTFPYSFPLQFFDYQSARFTIVVQFTSLSPGNIIFPLPFPIPFEVTPESILRCLFNKLKPANCRVVFEEL